MAGSAQAATIKLDQWPSTIAVEDLLVGVGFGQSQPLEVGEGFLGRPS